jgi:hypothetical protein
MNECMLSIISQHQSYFDLLLVIFFGAAAEGARPPLAEDEPLPALLPLGVPTALALGVTTALALGVPSALA